MSAEIRGLSHRVNQPLQMFPLAVRTVWIDSGLFHMCLGDGWSVCWSLLTCLCPLCISRYSCFPLRAIECTWTICPFTSDCHPICQMHGELIPHLSVFSGSDVDRCQQTHSVLHLPLYRRSNWVPLKNWQTRPTQPFCVKGALKCM